MSQLISLYVDGHANNSCFGMEDTAHKFNPTDIYRELRSAFSALGYEVNTADLNHGKTICAEIHIEGRPLSEQKQASRFLLAYENPVINPLNNDLEYLQLFDAAVSWNEQACKLGHVTQLMYPSRIEKRSFQSFEQRSQFLSLINANKAYKQVIPGDLYNERLNLIRFCEAHHPDQFFLYGRGWDKPTPEFGRGAKLKRSWVRFKTKAFGFRPFPSWRGEIESKFDVYDDCKFAICYENFSGFKNYLTEKIFDAFMSGCVPVYWGASNIEELISSDCYIDRRTFETDAQLMNYLFSMSADEYTAIQKNIAAFLESPQAKAFELRSHMQQVSSLMSKFLQADL